MARRAMRRKGRTRTGGGQGHLLLPSCTQSVYQHGMENLQIIVNIYNCRNVEELLSIFAQARDNGSTLKVVGGSYRIGSTNSDDIIVSFFFFEQSIERSGLAYGRAPQRCTRPLRPACCGPQPSIERLS